MKEQTDILLLLQSIKLYVFKKSLLLAMPHVMWDLSYPKVKVRSLSHVRLFATPWTIAHQAPPSMGFSRQECWSGLPFPSPGDLPRSPALQADALQSEPPGIKPVPSALGVCSFNQCTVREVPKVVQFLGKMALSQQEGLYSSSCRTAPQGFLSQDLLPPSLLLCACCVLSGSVVPTLQPHGL